MISYNMEVKALSRVNYSPSEFARKLPLYTDNCGHFIAEEGYFTERSGLDRYLLFYTLNGAGELEYQEKKILMEAGDFVLIDCREYQKYFTKKGQVWEFYWIHFSGGFTENFSSLFHGEIKFHLKKEILRQMMKELVYFPLQYTPRYEMEMSSKLYSLLIELASVQTKEEITSGKEAVDCAVDYIQRNYQEKILLKDLCELTNYSRYHFIRIFKKELGETPYEFINRFRVNHSKTLLTESGQAIETIARMVGFSDTNNYIIAFRKYTGMTPGQYRKEN